MAAAPWPRYGLCNLYSVCRGECLLGFLAVFSEVFFLVLSREKEITERIGARRKEAHSHACALRSPRFSTLLLTAAECTESWVLLTSFEVSDTP